MGVLIYITLLYPRGGSEPSKVEEPSVTADSAKVVEKAPEPVTKPVKPVKLTVEGAFQAVGGMAGDPSWSDHEMNQYGGILSAKDSYTDGDFYLVHERNSKDTVGIREVD